MVALIVVGSAPCAYEDYEAAKRLYPDAETMLVNGACTMFEHAEHMLCGHYEKTADFVAAREKAFPFAPPIRVHAPCDEGRPSNYHKVHFPQIAHWWTDTQTGSTSAATAAMIGLQMGCYPIIMAGCPMDGSGYSFEEASVPQEESTLRIGDPSVQTRDLIQRYKQRLAVLAQTTFRGRVFSMSGHTRAHLGPPPAIA